jgi:hypothetical protein
VTNVKPEDRSGIRRPSQRTLRWGAGAVALAVTPKCLLCVFGYLALAAGAQVEMCGATPSRAATVARVLAPYLAVATLGAAPGKSARRISAPPPVGVGGR